MPAHADKTSGDKSQSVANAVSQSQIGVESTLQLVDDRPEATAQRKLQEMADNSPQVKRAAQLQAMADHNSSPKASPIQRKRNNTGLPDDLKSGIENLSGMSLDDVKVHRNSDRPAQLQAHAFAQGTDIHLAAGQEKHLPHEAWHVVQQKQGRVKPTMQMKGKVNVNDDAGLENEADLMGAKALQMRGVGSPAAGSVKHVQPTDGNSDVAQLFAKAGDTINLEVKPGGPPVFMRNKALPDGGEEPKSGEIGGTGILDADNWDTVGVSPRDFHRAHAISQAFGGGGGANNVAWWSSAKETTWTESEEKVRGGGLAQVAAWKPGDVEEGTYKVTRTMKDSVDFKPGYLAKLNAAAAWGLDDSRAAWDRFKTRAVDGSVPFNQGKQQKAAYLASLNNYFNGMLRDLGYEKAGATLIAEMKLDYTRTVPGTGAGGSRDNLSLTVTADDVDPTAFGLKNEPENIWKAMVTANKGSFAKKFLATGNKRVNLPWAGPKSGVPRPDPIELTPQPDGWGIA